MSKIAPCLWFDGKAEEAAKFYVSLLPDSRIDAVVLYATETPGGSPGSVMTVEFTLAGSSYVALNGGPYFQFTPAISFFVNCADQAEVDRLWNALLDGGAPQQCGWITDRYGVSWQIVPEALGTMVKDKDTARARRVMDALMTMVKIDVAALEKAYSGLAA
jgi:predicted 3-demethylubiquinone-9 3-methyltransferase (glyoxalase superfamily)